MMFKNCRPEPRAGGERRQLFDELQHRLTRTAATGVLANDSDQDGNSLTVSSLTNPSHWHSPTLHRRIVHLYSVFELQRPR